MHMYNHVHDMCMCMHVVVDVSLSVREGKRIVVGRGSGLGA